MKPPNVGVIQERICKALDAPLTRYAEVAARDPLMQALRVWCYADELGKIATALRTVADNMLLVAKKQKRRRRVTSTTRQTRVRQSKTRRGVP